MRDVRERRRGERGRRPPQANRAAFVKTEDDAIAQMVSRREPPPVELTLDATGAPG